MYYFLVMATIKINVTCNTCNRQFNSLKLLELHYNTNHGQNDQLKCEICGYIATKTYNFERHKLTHENYCRQCDKKFESKRELRLHKKSEHPNDLTCPQCLRKYHSIKYLRLHEAKCGRRAPKTSKQCLHCTRQFCRPAIKDYHENICRQNPNNDEIYLCQYCGWRFKTHKSLMGHLNKSHKKEIDNQTEELFPGHRIDDNDVAAAAAAADLQDEDKIAPRPMNGGKKGASLKEVPWGNNEPPWSGTADEIEINEIYRKYSQSILREDQLR